MGLDLRLTEAHYVPSELAGIRYRPIDRLG
jgi:hypothetical protein